MYSSPNDNRSSNITDRVYLFLNSIWMNMFSLFLTYIFIYCGGACAVVCMLEDNMEGSKDRFAPPTMWALGIELWSSGSGVGTFTYRAILPTLNRFNLWDSTVLCVCWHTQYMFLSSVGWSLLIPDQDYSYRILMHASCEHEISQWDVIVEALAPGVSSFCSTVTARWTLSPHHPSPCHSVHKDLPMASNFPSTDNRWGHTWVSIATGCSLL